ncbi:hypothetical protein BJV74DRAFT_871230, partial [Russula compacta]
MHNITWHPSCSGSQCRHMMLHNTAWPALIVPTCTTLHGTLIGQPLGAPLQACPMCMWASLLS